MTPEEAPDRPARLAVHIAVHYIGCAAARPDGVGVPSRAGAFVECLAERVEKVTVVAFDQPAEPGFADGVEYTVSSANASFLSLGPKGTWRDFFTRRRYVAQKVGPPSADWDVLIFYHLPNRRAHLVYRSARCSRSVAYVVGTTSPSAIDRRLRRRPMLIVNRTWQWIQHRELLRRSDLLLANSRELLATVAPHPRCVRVVHLSHRRARHAHRQPDRMEGPDIDLLVAGRLTLEKGVVIAVEALATLIAEGVGARLHAVGEGPAQDAMIRRAQELGVDHALVLHGWVPAGDRLFELYRSMDAILLPVYGDEGFPSVIWEAMAHSVLVVSTRVRGARETFEHERELLFVPMHDHVAVADAVRRLIGDGALRRSLIANAYERSPDASMERTVDNVLHAISDCWPELSLRRS